MRECLLDLLSTCVKIMGFFFFFKNRQQQQEYTPIYHPLPWSIKEKQEFCLSPTFDETTAAANAHTCLHKTVEESGATQKKKLETDLHHIFQEDSVQEFEWKGGWVLLPVLTKSNSIGTQYVTLQMKIRWRKVKTCRFVSAKWFCAQQFPTVWWGPLKAQQRLTLAREECNKDCCCCRMIWPIIMIGPGGFAIGSLPPICNPSFSFDGWVRKKYT
jgi:hypothetical protein